MTQEIPQTMKAFQYSKLRHEHFEDNLTLSTIPLPQLPHSVSPSKPCILISVTGVSLNPADHHMATMPVIGSLLIKKPAIPGIDFSGRIVKIPDNLEEKYRRDLAVGDEVFGRLDFPFQLGTVAQYTLVQPNGISRAPKTGNGKNTTPAAHVAALGTAGLTAYQALVPFIKPGKSRVFLNGGSGGVGTFAIQIAKLLGAAHVTVACSEASAQLCKELGADEIIDYRSVDVVQELKSRAASDGMMYDHIIDNVAPALRIFEESHAFLTEGGSFVQVAASAESFKGIMTMFSRWLRPSWLGGVKRNWVFSFTKNDVKDLQVLQDWVENGRLKVCVDSEFNFEDVPQAFARLRTGRAKGKIIINVSSN